MGRIVPGLRPPDPHGHVVAPCLVPQLCPTPAALRRASPFGALFTLRELGKGQDATFSSRFPKPMLRFSFSERRAGGGERGRHDGKHGPGIGAGAEAAAQGHRPAANGGGVAETRKLAQMSSQPLEKANFAEGIRFGIRSEKFGFRSAGFGKRSGSFGFRSDVRAHAASGLRGDAKPGRKSLKNKRRAAKAALKTAKRHRPRRPSASGDGRVLASSARAGGYPKIPAALA